MIEITRKQLADLRGCKPNNVTKAKLRKSSGGLYNLLEDETKDWAMEPYVKRKIDEYMQAVLGGYEDNSLNGLLADKIREEIKYKSKQSRKMDLQHAKEKQDLIPMGMISILLGHFASGIRNNFLQIGNRIARGNIKLRDRIEKEIKKSIEKTMDTAEKELRKYSEKLIEGMGEE